MATVHSMQPHERSRQSAQQRTPPSSSRSSSQSAGCDMLRFSDDDGTCEEMRGSSYDCLHPIDGDDDDDDAHALDGDGILYSAFTANSNSALLGGGGGGNNSLSQQQHYCDAAPFLFDSLSEASTLSIENQMTEFHRTAELTLGRMIDALRSAVQSEAAFAAAEELLATTSPVEVNPYRPPRGARFRTRLEAMQLMEWKDAVSDANMSVTGVAVSRNGAGGTSDTTRSRSHSIQEWSEKYFYFTMPTVTQTESHGSVVEFPGVPTTPRGCGGNDEISLPGAAIEIVGVRAKFETESRRSKRRCKHDDETTEEVLACDGSFDENEEYFAQGEREDESEVLAHDSRCSSSLPLRLDCKPRHQSYAMLHLSPRSAISQETRDERIVAWWNTICVPILSDEQTRRMRGGLPLLRLPPEVMDASIHTNLVAGKLPTSNKGKRGKKGKSDTSRRLHDSLRDAHMLDGDLDTPGDEKDGYLHMGSHDDAVCIPTTVCSSSISGALGKLHGSVATTPKVEPHASSSFRRNNNNNSSSGSNYPVSQSSLFDSNLGCDGDVISVAIAVGNSSNKLRTFVAQAPSATVTSTNRRGGGFSSSVSPTKSRRTRSSEKVSSIVVVQDSPSHPQLIMVGHNTRTAGDDKPKPRHHHHHEILLGYGSDAEGVDASRKRHNLPTGRQGATNSASYDRLRHGGFQHGGASSNTSDVTSSEMRIVGSSTPMHLHPTSNVGRDDLHQSSGGGRPPMGVGLTDDSSLGAEPQGLRLPQIPQARTQVSNSNGTDTGGNVKPKGSLSRAQTAFVRPSNKKKP